jgi:hypothetical protein
MRAKVCNEDEMAHLTTPTHTPTTKDATLAKEWLPKREAAKVLDLSPRSLLLMAQKGVLRTRREIDPANKQMSVTFHAGDLERERYLRNHPDERPAPEQPPQAAQGEQDGGGAARLAVLPKKAGELVEFARLVATITAARHAPPINQLLTLEEAAEERHMSRELLLRLIHAGHLPAVQDKPIRKEGEKRARAGSSWRVFRRDLEALQGVTHGLLLQAKHAASPPRKSAAAGKG